MKTRNSLTENDDEMLHQSQKLEAFGLLTCGIAHDLNNILAVIRMCSESLIARFAAEGSSFKELEQVKQAGERAAKLTHQLLTFSREQVLAFQILDLNQLIERMAEMLQRLITDNIQLVLDLDPRLNVVKVDPGQMEQVIMNLAVNARDAMPDGGKLTISTRNFRVIENDLTPPEVPPGEYILISVEDKGLGIEKEIVPHIFEIFFTTKGSGGTGLGLFTVYGIVKQSGGFITVNSEKDVGTTFSIYLPKATPP